MTDLIIFIIILPIIISVWYAGLRGSRPTLDWSPMTEDHSKSPHYQIFRQHFKHGLNHEYTTWILLKHYEFRRIKGIVDKNGEPLLFIKSPYNEKLKKEFTEFIKQNP